MRWVQFLWKAIIYIPLTALFVLALGLEDALGDEVAIQLHGLSYHADSTYADNEVNLGLGLRYYHDKWTAIDYVTIGGYRNSVDQPSYYAGVGWEYEVNNWLTLGATLGLVTGYADVLDEVSLDPAPYLAPTLTLWRRVHVVGVPYPEPVMEVSVDIIRHKW